MLPHLPHSLSKLAAAGTPRWLTSLQVVALALFVFSGVALAGPGGEVAEFFFKTRVGQIIGLILAIIFIPLIVYVWVREKIGVARTRKDLEGLAQRYPWFTWSRIEARVRKALPVLYTEWGKGRLEKSASFMTPVCFDSNNDILERWSEEGKRNVTRLKKLKKVRPLWCRTEDEESYSIMAIGITVDLEDYLMNLTTKKVLKGSKGKVKADHEVIWMMVDVEGEWFLHTIEEGSNSLSFAQQKNMLDTRQLELRRREIIERRSAAAAPQVAEHLETYEAEDAEVDVAERRQHEGQ